MTEFDPQDEADLRELLHEARVTAPMPEAVVARLQAALDAEWAPAVAAAVPAVVEALTASTDPVAAGGDEGATATVTSISQAAPAAGKRRGKPNRSLQWLVAAAALVIGGVVVGPRVMSGDSMSASESADAGAESALEDVGRADLDSPMADLALPPEIFGRPLGEAAAELYAAPDPGAITTNGSDQRGSQVADCVLPDEVTGDQITQVLSQGQPSWLVFRAGDAGAVVVDLHTCIGGAVPVESATFTP